MFYVLKCVYLLFCAAFMRNKRIIKIVKSRRRGRLTQRRSGRSQVVAVLPVLD